MTAGTVASDLADIICPEVDRRLKKQAGLDQLTAKHPDWSQINESDSFWGWYSLKKESFGFRDSAHEKEMLNDWDFVSDLLDRFKSENPGAY